MKLYSLDNSPYAARVQIQIRHKDLPVEVCPPPEPLRTEAFAQRFPLAKIPVLAVDDSTDIAESLAIMHYLEECFPEPSLLGASPLGRAQDLMLARCADNHLAPALFPLFALLMRGARDDASAETATFDRELAKLEALLASLPPWPQRTLQIGDICLATVVAYGIDTCPRFGMDDPLAAYPRLQEWWDWVRAVPAVEAGLGNMITGHHALLAKLAASAEAK